MKKQNFSSIKTLQETLGLDKLQAKWVRGMIKGEVNPEDFKSVQDLVKSCYNYPDTLYQVMTALNEILEGHGIETLQDDWGSPAWGEYVNMGETYVPTIVYLYDKERFVVSSWGDLAERR